MNVPKSARDVAVVLAVALGGGFGLFGLTSLPWTITMPASFVLGALALLVDLTAFRRPIAPGEPLRGASLIFATSVAVVAGLLLAFEAGLEARSTAHTYTYLVTNHDGLLTVAHSVPSIKAQNNSSFETGELVHVDCAVRIGNVLWFRLAQETGWLNQDEIMPAPYTGQGQPPACPR
jgi:hypothetical protein